MPALPPIQIPAHFTVWAASDLHGQLAAVDRLLAAAGLTDGTGRWTAPPATALVVTGDVVDRGPDSVALARRLAELRTAAARAEGLVAILEGNHEMQVLGGLDGDPQLFRAFLTFGGGATLLSAGLTPAEWADRPAAEIAGRVDELAPGFRETLRTFASYGRWRDVLFVHAGPVPFQDLGRFERSAERLWIRERFFASPDPFPEADAWSPYRASGVGRVVFGHSPVERPTFAHDGRCVNLDTGRGQQVTLAKIAPEGDLRASTFLFEPTAPRPLADPPVSVEEIREFDAQLPSVVDAWRA